MPGRPNQGSGQEAFVFRRDVAPTIADGLGVGDLWIDTSAATPLIKVCKVASPAVLWAVVTPV